MRRTKRPSKRAKGPAPRPTPDAVMHLRLADIMSKPVVTARPGERVRVLAKRMNLHRIGCVVVVDRGRVVGVATERDLLRMIAKGVSADEATAEQVMTRPAVCGGLDEEIPDAIRQLVLHGIKKLPVLDDGKLVGIVTFTDFAQLAPAYSDFFAAALGEADRRARQRFERYVHGPADPWTFV